MRTQYLLGTQFTETPDGDPIPPTATIYNATRPLVGSYTWTGDWIRGRFFAVVIDEWSDSHRINADLDATRLVWVNIDTVRAEVLAYYKRRYPDKADTVTADVLSEYTDDELMWTFCDVKAEEVAE